MRKLYTVLIIVAAAFSTQTIFANYQDASNSHPCKMIAQACLAGGFVRSGAANKKFWHDCMKPILMGQTVQGVTVDPATVKNCRVNKIDHLKKELKALQKVS